MVWGHTDVPVQGVIMDNIKLSVRELVEFIYKSGDINVRNLGADRAIEGIKWEKIIIKNTI